MRKFLLVCTWAILASVGDLKAQESYGRTLNLGLGIGYYGYIGKTPLVFNANYEFDVADNFTLAPTITFYTYYKNYNFGKNGRYRYRETVVPIGVKGTYYFDELLGASSPWDFYAAGTIGFAIRTQRWDDGYPGDKDYYRNASPLYLHLHIGTEYHFNEKIGMYLDLSTGVSTLGVAIHM